MSVKDFSQFVQFNPALFDHLAELGQTLGAQLEKITRLQFDAGLASTQEALAASRALLEVREPSALLQWQEAHVKPGFERAAASAREQAVQEAVGLFQAAGLVVSPLKDIPGLAVMRTVAMLANEAADAVNQGVCSAGDADAAMQLGVNYPRGPLLWAEQVGLPAVRDALAHLGNIYGEDRYRISPLLQQRIDEGRKFHE